ncbi:MAG: ribonuclease E/G [Oligoflexales bacterium]
MSKQTLAINMTPFEHRFAYLEDGVLKELFIEDTQTVKAKIGQVYHAKIDRVLPGLAGAFLHITKEQKGFLQETSEVKLRQGDSILVQVIKEGTPTKGPQVSTSLTFTTENLVLLYNQPGVIKISNKINDKKQVQRLQNWATSLTLQHGILLRTRAADIDFNSLEQDWKTLSNQVSIFEQTPKISAPSLIHHQPIEMRHGILTHWGRYHFDEVISDHAQPFPLKPNFLLSAQWKTYHDPRPLFETLGIEKSIQNAFKSKVELPSGGNIVIQSTEALTSIDINTARSSKGTHLQDTILKTNLEACKAIALQIRLRNLVGILIIDFIDMTTAQNRASIEKEFQNWMNQDPVAHRILPLNELGLIQLTRKRSYPPLSQMTTTPCSICKQTGLRLSIKAQCMAAFRKAAYLQASHKNIHITGPRQAMEWFQTPDVERYFTSLLHLKTEGHEITVSPS